MIVINLFLVFEHSVRRNMYIYNLIGHSFNDIPLKLKSNATL